MIGMNAVPVGQSTIVVDGCVWDVDWHRGIVSGQRSVDVYWLSGRRRKAVSLNSEVPLGWLVGDGRSWSVEKKLIVIVTETMIFVCVALREVFDLLAP